MRELPEPDPPDFDWIRYVLAVSYHWTPEQVAEVPDHLLLAVLDA